MNLDKLRAETGFKLTPLQCGPDDYAFLGFIGFANGKSAEAKILCDQFVADGGLKDVHSNGDIPAVAGKFIDWLIVNHWGEEEKEVA